MGWESPGSLGLASIMWPLSNASNKERRTGMTAGSPANRAARCHHASVYPSPLLALHTALLQPRLPSFSLSIPTTPGDSHSSFHMPFSKPGIWYFLLLPADIYRKPDLGVGECRGSFNLLCPSVTYSGRHSDVALPPRFPFTLCSALALGAGTPPASARPVLGAASAHCRLQEVDVGSKTAWTGLVHRCPYPIK